MSYFCMIYPLSTTLSERLDRVDHVRSHEKKINLNDLDLSKLCGKENIKSKSIESKKHRKLKCQVKKISKENTVVCLHPHSSYILSEFLYPIFSHSVFLSIFLMLIFRYFHIQYFCQFF
jgi:hypothetical protein